MALLLAMDHHELNNFTMQEAINWYPKLKSACKVWCINLYFVHPCELMSFIIVYHACRCGVEHQPGVPRTQLLTSFIFSMSVIYICSHYRDSIPSLILIPHSDISGQLTATGSASPSSSGGSSGSGSAQKGGALGMPAVSGGLVGAVVAAVAFVGGIARVIA